MKIAEEKKIFLYFMQNFQKSIKNATKLQKCDFADYILRILRHFLGIFENFA